jgi:hypothetical protein
METGGVAAAISAVCRRRDFSAAANAQVSHLFDYRSPLNLFVVGLRL